MGSRKIWIGLAVSVFLVILFILIETRHREKKVVPKTNINFSQLVKNAEELIKEGDLIKARELYKQAREMETNVERLTQIKKKIEDLNMKILFSPTIIDDCSIQYEVKPKDALVKIAKKFGTTVGLIKRANKLKSDIIRPGQKLKINTCKFSILIDKSQNLLFLKSKNEVIKTYVVSTGENNSTPAGKFKIVNKLINPTWYKTGAIIPPDSPKNILGTRWMGFNIAGYGIHGTTDPDSIGKQVTMGCIRMRNSDVEELFDIVPVGTEVVIID